MYNYNDNSIAKTVMTKLYHRYYGNSHVIKVNISLLNFLGIQHHPSATFFFISWKPVRTPYCNYGIYTMATSGFINPSIPITKDVELLGWKIKYGNKGDLFE